MRPRAGQILLLLAGLIVVLSGCRSYEDVNARYQLEKMMWDAQVQERKINIAFIMASQRDLDLAIQKFEKVVAYDPLRVLDPDEIDDDVLGDIKRIQIVSRVALANLYFFDERYDSASDIYRGTLDDTGLDFGNELDVRLSLAKTLYMSGESGPLKENCATLFKEIAENETFWEGGFELRDVFLSIPLVLARMYRDSKNVQEYEAFYQVAADFYTRIVDTWPDTDLAPKAIYSRANLYLQQEDYRKALTDIDRLLLETSEFSEQEADFRLLKGEIFAYALEDIPSGRRIFRELVKDLPGTGAAYAALYNLAVLDLGSGSEDEGLAKLRDIEDATRVPEEIVAKAMLTRALHYEKTGRWDESLQLLRRLMRLFGSTTPAMEAPLIVTRHYISAGNERMAQRSLERATDFYVSLMTKESKYRGDRLMIEDFLIENYLSMGQARQAAEFMEENAPYWDEVSFVGGMFKSALIYSVLLDDRESASRILKKSIELFPETRYAKIARRQLEELAENR